MKNALCLPVLLNLLAGHPTSAWAPTGIATSRNLPRLLTNVGSRSSTSPRLYVSGNDVEQDKKEGVAPSDKTSDSFVSATGGSSSKNWNEPIPYADLTIGVLKENFPGENRVSQTPDSIQNLIKAGFTVVVEAGGAYQSLATPGGSNDNCIHLEKFLTCLLPRIFLWNGINNNRTNSWRKSFVQ
jgi:hypothetical protein